MTEQLLYITQVASYQNGPAGVHRVLPQATVAMAQLAEMVGLDFTHVTDVRTIGHDELAKSRIIGLFTIGETPWAPEQKRQLLERLRAGNIGYVDPTAARSASDTRLPLAWCFEEGRGRIFYTALSHFPIAYEYSTYLRHLSGGLSWVLGHDR